MSRTNGHNAPRRGSAGFTLTELIIAMTISAFIFAGIMSSYLFMGRNLTRLTNSQQLEEFGRRANYLFNQDVSAAVSVLYTVGTPSSSSSLYLTLPSGATVTLPDGSRSTLGAATTIAYVYNSATGTLTRSVGAASATLLSGSIGRVYVNGTAWIVTGVAFSSFNFNYYNKAGTPLTPSAATAPSIKEAEMVYSATLGTSAAGTQSQHTSVSPRVILRNTANLL